MTLKNCTITAKTVAAARGVPRRPAFRTSPFTRGAFRFHQAPPPHSAGFVFR